MLDRKQLFMACLFVAFLGINVVFLWKRLPRPHVPLPPTQDRQASQLVEWEALPVTFLGSPSDDVERALRAYPRGKCPDQSDTLSVEFNHLTTTQQDDLFHAVSQLLRCYHESTPDALILYMADRGESFNSKILDVVKREKVDLGLISAADLSSMSNAEFFAKVWEWQNTVSHWHGLVESAGCIHVWRCGTADEGFQVPLGKTMNNVFQSVTTYAHLFQPQFTFSQACDRNERVLVADAMLVVQLGEKRKLERSPWYVRFWYSDSDQRWHPLRLSHVNVVPDISEAVQLLF